MSLFTVTDNDRRIYEEHIKDFLPDNIIDFHTHIWKGMPVPKDGEVRRTVMWPDLVASENTIEQIQEAYRLFFPGKTVTPLMFASKMTHDNYLERNEYVADAVRKSGYPALYFSLPTQSADEVEREIFRHGYLGLKAYLNLAPEYLPEKEIRILDFFPEKHLEVLNKHGLIMMLHLPRNGRFKDPVNIGQIKYIVEKYPNLKLIIAHVGRAYCVNDIGDAFEQLKDYKDIYYDITANTSEPVFEELLKNISIDRIMFGSDEPIIRMRMKRIEENNTYINLVPPGLYGDPSLDPHLREVSEEEGKKLTFFMYEEILAFKKAIETLGFGKKDVEKVFYSNAKKLWDETKNSVRAD